MCFWRWCYIEYLGYAVLYCIGALLARCPFVGAVLFFFVVLLLVFSCVFAIFAGDFFLVGRLLEGCPYLPKWCSKYFSTKN